IGANSSALGRVLLAFAPPAQQKRVLARPLKAFSPCSIVDPAQLQARLDFVQTNWWELAINENAYGISTLAAPVFDERNSILAAVAVVMPSMAGSQAPDPALVQAVQDCAAAISADFNATAWVQRREQGAAR